ncbi:hypothetical protein HY988_00470 [Candidatus Micrarchaeota archaeon]|nr:hypothetical protein [Candidatus Micrarchaeota archaeon]
MSARRKRGVIAAATMAIMLAAGVAVFSRKPPMNENGVNNKPVPVKAEETAQIETISLPKITKPSKVRMPQKDLIEELAEDIPTSAVICLPQPRKQFDTRSQDHRDEQASGGEFAEINEHTTPLDQANSIEQALTWAEIRLGDQYSQLFGNMVSRNFDGSLKGPSKIQPAINSLMRALHVGTLRINPGLKNWDEKILGAVTETYNRSSGRVLREKEVDKLIQDSQTLIKMIGYLSSLPLQYPETDEEGEMQVTDSFSKYMSQVRDAGAEDLIPNPECIARTAQVKQLLYLSRGALAYLLVNNPEIGEDVLNQLTPAERVRTLTKCFAELFKGDADARKIEDFYGSLPEDDQQVFVEMLEQVKWTEDILRRGEELERSKADTDLRNKIRKLLDTERRAQAEMAQEAQRKHEEELRATYSLENTRSEEVN